MAGRYQKCHLLELLQGLVHNRAGPTFASKPQLLVPASNQMCIGDTSVFSVRTASRAKHTLSVSIMHLFVEYSVDQSSDSDV